MGQILLLYNIIQLALLITGILLHIFLCTRQLALRSSVHLSVLLRCRNQQKGSMHSALHKHFSYCSAQRKSNPADNLFISPISPWPTIENWGEGKTEKLFFSFWRSSIKNEWTSDSVKIRLGLGLSPRRSRAEWGFNRSELNICSSPFLSILGVPEKEHTHSANPLRLKV